ncbi:UNVERIFIED_CONTAM: hypothetical protein FKN15_066914 [Acipenser sinensis]
MFLEAAEVTAPIVKKCLEMLSGGYPARRRDVRRWSQNQFLETTVRKRGSDELAEKGQMT